MLTSVKSIYRMELHQRIIEGSMEILRVPGGWIYSIGGIHSVFVPLNNEFIDD
jgi:hypothetical protein